jgi:hypothetical protein
MPRLIYVIAAEKLIVDKDEGSGSLISLLGQITTPVTPENLDETTGHLKTPSVLVFKWVIAAYWEYMEGDEDKLFQQKMFLEDPEGRPTGVEQILNFQFEGSMRSHRVWHRIQGIPIQYSGVYRAKVFIRARSTKGKRWSKWEESTLSYPITVTFSNLLSPADIVRPFPTAPIE